MNSKKILCIVNILLSLSSSVFGMIPEIKWGMSSRQGIRSNQEDAHQHIVDLDNIKNLSFFAVYDGHAGRDAAQLAAEELHNEFVRAKGTITQRLGTAIKRIDDRAQKAGTTAIIAVINGNELILSWVGDSRAVLERNQKVEFASKDHKLTGKERARVGEGNIKKVGVDRVFGILAMPRAIGDHDIKKIKPGVIIAQPDFQTMQLSPQNNFLILACDGVWDVIKNEEAVQIVDKALQTPVNKLKELYPQYPKINDKPDVVEQESNNQHVMLAARALRDTAFKKGSKDNISVIVVQFNWPKISLEQQLQTVLNKIKKNSFALEYKSYYDFDKTVNVIEQFEKNNTLETIENLKSKLIATISKIDNQAYIGEEMLNNMMALKNDLQHALVFLLLTQITKNNYAQEHNSYLNLKQVINSINMYVQDQKSNKDKLIQNLKSLYSDINTMAFIGEEAEKQNKNLRELVNQAIQEIQNLN